jgi:L-fuconate dehydratase
VRIVAAETYDVRFPTSRELDGSDAMNPDPDYSAAYVVLRTDDGSEGHGFTFTIGRGNEVARAAIASLAPLVIGGDVSDLGSFARRLTHDSQIRWLGPEKGVMHLAAAALINAAWDLAARRAGQPVWQFLASLPPEAVIDMIDWRYLSDALTPSEALELLLAARPGMADRVSLLTRDGYPAYTTSVGWLGYPDEKLVRLSRDAVADGFRLLKLKVGADVTDDLRRLRLVRAAVGDDVRIAVDANQRWDVGAAIDWMTTLAPAHPYWIEEPTSPDDILGHAAIRRALQPLGIRVATGEHVQNRIIFKQMLQADAIDVVQIDACRVAGVNENLAILLLAAKFGKPVCPHAGGVGLCELVQHLALFDYAAVSGRLDNRVIEYVDHLHEHFVDPVVIRNGRYQAPAASGFSSRMKAASLAEYAFPDGPAWSRPA